MLTRGAGYQPAAAYQAAFVVGTTKRSRPEGGCRLIARPTFQHSLSDSFESFRETARPADLAGPFGHFILAELNLKVGHVSTNGVKGDAVIDRRVQIVGFVVPYCYIAAASQILEH